MQALMLTVQYLLCQSNWAEAEAEAVTYYHLHVMGREARIDVSNQPTTPSTIQYILQQCGQTIRVVLERQVVATIMILLQHVSSNEVRLHYTGIMRRSILYTKYDRSNVAEWYASSSQLGQVSHSMRHLPSVKKNIVRVLPVSQPMVRTNTCNRCNSCQSFKHFPGAWTFKRFVDL
jgi:hypothetical protein